jgi:tetratricopeptide (TPR) repeat protein
MPRVTSGSETSRSVPLWRRVLAPLLLVVLVLAVYQPTLQADFVVWDDDDHVYENPNVLASDGYARAWADWRDTAFYPLTFTTFFIEWHLADGEPWLFHLNNVLLHAANVVCVGLLARTIGLERGVAWLAAGLWGLHPLAVGSVAWITERKNVLYVFFYLAALLTYARTLQTSPARGRVLWGVSLLLAGASLLSKATAVTLPFGIGLLHWSTGRPLDRRVAGRVLSYLALALAVGLLHIYREEVVAPLGLGTRILIAARAAWFYVACFLWPHGLAAMYPRWDPEAALSWGLPALIGLAVALAIMAWQARRLPRAAWFAVGHFAANIGLVVGVIWFPYMRYSFVADHLVYFPSVGLALLAAMGASALLDRVPAAGPLRLPLAIGVCVALAVGSWRQTGMWHDTETLWGRTLAVAPTSTVAHNNLGVTLLEQGRPEDARRHFEETLRIDPEDATAVFNMGVLAASRERWDEAIAYYKRALRTNPANALVWNNLGVAAAERGQVERAAAFYRHAIALQGDDADTHTNLGAALEKLGRRREAIASYRTAVGLNPLLAKAHFRLGSALAAEGDHAEAVSVLERARDLEPASAEILRQLGLAYLAIGDTAAGRGELEKAVGLDPLAAEIHRDLAILLLDLGEIEGGARHLDRALALGPRKDAGRAHLEAGALLERRGAVERAASHYRRATVLEPDEPEAFFRLGVALSAAGLHREAETEYRAVLALDPGHAQATAGLGAALLAQGETNEAVDQLRRAVRLMPEDETAARNLARALAAAGAPGERAPRPQ